MKIFLRVLCALAGCGVLAPVQAGGLDQLKSFLDTNRSARAVWQRQGSFLRHQGAGRLWGAKQAVDPHHLDSVDDASPGTVLALAAFCGTTRLIDNVELT